MCHDSFARPYCAKISEGGCPCPNNDEVKCGASQYSSGYCARACCDWAVEEACFDENNRQLGCARFDEGGCENENQRKAARFPNTAPEGDKQGKGAHPSPSATADVRTGHMVVFEKRMTTAPAVNNVVHGRHPTPSVTADVSSSKKRQGRHPTPSTITDVSSSKKRQGRHPTPSVITDVSSSKKQKYHGKHPSSSALTLFSSHDVASH